MIIENLKSRENADPVKKDIEIITSTWISMIVKNLDL